MRLSTIFWILCITAGVFGVIIAFAGVWIEVTTARAAATAAAGQAMKQGERGLYMLVLFPVLLALAGIFATVATKFEAEGL